MKEGDITTIVLHDYYPEGDVDVEVEGIIIEVNNNRYTVDCGGVLYEVEDD